MKSVVVSNLLFLAVVACARSAAAAKCSDHLLAMKADDFSEEDGGKYGSSTHTHTHTIQKITKLRQ